MATSKLLITEEKIAEAKALLVAEDTKPYSSKERSIAIMLQNQLHEAQHTVSAEKLARLFEAAPTTNTANIQNYDPVLIKMLRRALPNLVAYDVIGVQPMNMPTGLIFYQKARYVDGGTLTPPGATANEALFQEALTGFSGDKTTQQGDNPATLLAATPGPYTVGRAMTTAQAEALGSDGGTVWGEMSFTIEKITVTAGSRALRSDYTVEMAQDLKNVHGLEAQSILSDILSNQILSEINREIFRTMYIWARVGMQQATNPGIWDVDADSAGRWFQEDAVSVIYWLGKDSNQINLDIRFGRGNFFVVSQNFADVLAAAERLDTNSVSLGDIDGAGNTFVGTVGRFKVYLDPYINDAQTSFACVGFKGATDLEAGMFYSPYVPLEMFEAVNALTMQPAIAFKTRYALTANPYSTTPDPISNPVGQSGYFRKSAITGF